MAKTISQGVRGLGLRECRYVGLDKVHLQHISHSNCDEWDSSLRVGKKVYLWLKLVFLLLQYPICGLTQARQRFGSPILRNQCPFSDDNLMQEENALFFI